MHFNSPNPITERSGAARGAEQRKVTDYEKCLDPNSQSLMPLAFELLGGWSPTSLRFFDMIKRVGLQKRDLQGHRGIASGLASGDVQYRLGSSGT